MSDAPPKSLKTPPPSHGPNVILSYPRPHLLVITFNRPNQMNSMTPGLRDDLLIVLDWFDTEPDLWALIVTGAGRLFCAGADLKGPLIPAWVWGIESRQSLKPIIGAANGDAYGGGLEILLNCDLVGYRGAGGLERLVRTVGRQRAAELLLTAKIISAAEAVIPTAIKLAETIIDNSPDSIRSTKRAIHETMRHGNIEEAYRSHLLSSESQAVYVGDNIKEGLNAFANRFHPKTMYMGHLDESLPSDLDCDETSATKDQLVPTVSGDSFNNGVAIFVEGSVAVTSVNHPL
ncbi:hypothetical protein BS47DRAFT_1390598 [Hydnum rufescens UP504]|uniref:Uncharacterized protein n=1 Tax=Hydnum rufescens UP504 TaxID=1448309 RepID=A0A9P6B308_9AGAM|nr:hypothetical protein BS47DRAFT_1390598 [Hydnum rufescens UP504]